jgi:hypothetical protein
MSIRKTGAVTGYVIRAESGEVPLGTDEEGRVVTARVAPAELRNGNWGPAEEAMLTSENEAADQ